jgi:membrane-associated phospholipid phosphatase
MRAGDQFRPPPPPAFGSPEFAAAVAEVRRFADTRTPGQLRFALFWADGAGTVTPPGHWNVIAADLIERYRLDERRAAHALALLNMAQMDAGIACWDAKYVYWLIRPSQVDPGIRLAVPLPNFPSYVSGHAAFSGAAAEVLAALFPAERRRLRAMAEEAAMSRLYGGIHYRFDSDRGLELGRKIAGLALARHRAETSVATASASTID